jgi:hypothetical protein
MSADAADAAVRGDAAVRLDAARARLVHELAGLSGDAAASALDRCPYRDRHDRCTFSHGCRNQRRARGLPVRCAGGPLDRRPA